MMKITSKMLNKEGMIPKMYTCEGENIIPPIKFENVPDNTKSLVLIVHDPDAPSGDFVHWVLWNIDPAIGEIKEGEMPIGAKEGVNDTGLRNWKGPCPPSGIHHYNFHFYALDTMLDIPETSDKVYLRNKIIGHTIEEASLIGLYKMEDDK